jgi:hypothetical protein
MDNNFLNPASTSRGEANFENDPSPLWQYVQDLSPETVAQMSQPASPEVLKMMERQIAMLLGNLPPEGFGVMITTSREHLGRLLASTMLNGYFLRNVEQRLAMETVLQPLEPPATPDN